MIERPLGHGRLPGPGHMSTQSLVEFVCVVFWSHTHPSKHKHTYWGVSRKPGSIHNGGTQSHTHTHIHTYTPTRRIHLHSHIHRECRKRQAQVRFRQAQVRVRVCQAQAQVRVRPVCLVRPRAYRSLPTRVFGADTKRHFTTAATLCHRWSLPAFRCRIVRSAGLAPCLTKVASAAAIPPADPTGARCARGKPDRSAAGVAS